MTKYLEEISQQAISNIIEAIRQFRHGEFEDSRNLPRAIAAILEHDLEEKEFQEFAVENYSQIVNIIFDKTPKKLFIKKDVKGIMFFQVDEKRINAY